MENLRNIHFDPKEFLGIKVFSPLEHEKLFGGAAESADRPGEKEIERINAPNDLI